LICINALDLHQRAHARREDDSSVGVQGHIVKAHGRHKRVRHHLSRKQRWTRRVRARILANLGHHPVLAGIVAALLLPGGFVLVPVIAWWHRRRR